jgi:colanic acid biosynthesis glycosyl transferase WcaI
MLNKISEKSSHKNPYYFPNWVSSEKINPELHHHHNYIDKTKFTILYSGNVGEKQDWDLCEKLCELINSVDEIEIVIVGDGAYFQELKRRLTRFNFVKFFPLVPYNELSDLLCSADVHFLFQKQDVIDTIMPSKILGMMASNKPSIITGNAKSEVTKIIEQSKGGYYFSDNEPKQIYNAILEMKTNALFAYEMGTNARNFILKSFSEQSILSNFKNKIDSLLDEK